MIRSRPLLALTTAELISQLGSSLSGLASAVVRSRDDALDLAPGRGFRRRAAPVLLVFDLARAPVIALVPLLHEIGGLSYALMSRGRKGTKL